VSDRLRKQFATYQAAVIPANAPEVQRQECRRAFFAGAKALMHEIVNGLSDEEQTTDQDLDLMAGLERELDAFADMTKRGLA
jgi:hypothetical protein